MSSQSDRTTEPAQSNSNSNSHPTSNLVDGVTVPFKWTCKCTNVTVHGSIQKKEEERIHQLNSDAGAEGTRPGSSLSAWIGPGEDSKQPEYIIYEGAGETRGRVRMPSDEQGTWRRCLLCDAKLYKVPGSHTRDEAAPQECWVEINLNDVLYGSKLDNAMTRKPLAFSGVRLPLPHTRSEFGRPPSDEVEYKPEVRTESESPPKQPLARPRGRGLIPVAHDDYFLPPPFVPNHPQLRKLCHGAVRHLTEYHTRLEDEVVEFIKGKTAEMRALEEEVRSEVELLWNVYHETNAEARASTSRRRGSRANESRSKSREPVQTKFSPSPVFNNTNATTAGFRSRNGQTNASLSVDDKPSTFAPGSLLTTSLSANAPPARNPNPPVESSTSPDRLVDSYLEETSQVAKNSDERAVAMSYVFSALEAVKGEAKQKEDQRLRHEEKLPVPTIAEEGDDEDSRKKGVKFDETAETERDDKEQGDASDVFQMDFEPDGDAGPSTSNDPPVDASEMPERDYPDRVAAYAPSHRAAWKKGTTGRAGNDLEIIGRSDNPSPTADDEDVSKVSSLATSMPVQIARQPLRQISGFSVLERKTSLSEREGKLVPPLRSAMKRRGEQNPATSTATAGRSVAIEDVVQGGTTQKDGFVPPHVLVRDEEKARAKASGASRSIYDR